MSPTKPWKRKCAGTNRAGEPCRQWAMIGATVCAAHGGKAPQVRAAAARRMQLARAEAEADRLAIEVETDPSAAILGAVRRAMGAVWFFGERVNVLEGITQTDRLAGGGSVERLSVAAEEYRLWCDRLVTYSAAALRSGIEERRVQVEEAQVEIFGQFVRDLLTSAELGLSLQQQQQGLAVAGRLMRALPAAA